MGDHRDPRRHDAVAATSSSRPGPSAKSRPRVFEPDLAWSENGEYRGGGESNESDEDEMAISSTKVCASPVVIRMKNDTENTSSARKLAAVRMTRMVAMIEIVINLLQERSGRRPRQVGGRRARLNDNDCQHTRMYVEIARA